MNYWIALSLVEGIGLFTTHQLLNTFGSPEKIFEEKISKNDFPRIKEDIDFTKIKDFYLKSAEKIIEQCENISTEIICFGSPNYPKLLKNINQAPLVLYCKGNSKILSKRGVAIVGSREPNANGEKDTKEIATGLSENGFVIVSGLARGIDTIAHTSALEMQKETIAVMATGINEITPIENTGLAKRIIENGGAVITEQIPDELAFAPNFVQRNRIISGLSECSIVISAPQRSGALHTAKFAEQQGRKIMAAPGARSDERYGGCNKLLLKSNVVPALEISGIISYINGTKKVEQIGMFDIPKVKPTNPQVFSSPIIQYLSKNPISLENLSLKSGIYTDELYEILFDLSFDGSIKQDMSGNYYI